MQYIEITNETEIKPAVDTIRQICGGLHQAVFGGERESTMSGRQVLTVFLKFEPVVKVEADKEMIDLLLTKIEERKTK